VPRMGTGVKERKEVNGMISFLPLLARVATLAVPFATRIGSLATNAVKAITSVPVAAGLLGYTYAKSTTLTVNDAPKGIFGRITYSVTTVLWMTALALGLFYFILRRKSKYA